MNNKKLADYDNPLVKKKALELTKGAVSERKKLEAIFHYVRDDIIFQFCPELDLMKASETIERGEGVCNNKSTLFLALAKASGIKARIHFSLIDKKIMQGLFKGIMYKRMPDAISHSWVDVYVDGKWRRIDSYINDRDFYLAGRKELKRREWDTGFSVACSKAASSIDFNIDEEKFVQMDAVVEDQGYYDDPIDYYNSDLYQNRPNAILLLMYRLAIIGINRNVKKMRKSCSTGLCGFEFETVSN